MEKCAQCNLDVSPNAMRCTHCGFDLWKHRTKRTARNFTLLLSALVCSLFGVSVIDNASENDWFTIGVAIFAVAAIIIFCANKIR